MRNKLNSKRTEAALSILVTSALVITLAITVASAIKKGSDTNEHNNIVNLNETESYSLTIENTYSVKDETSKKDYTEAPKKTTDSDTDDRPFDSSVAAENETDAPVAVDAKGQVNTGYSFSEADTLNMPVNGEIILEYNMDNTIWFKTLGVYKCNPGMYISGEAGTPVCASAPGMVASITYDEELGNVVTVDIGNGYKTSYGQLKNINVSEGEILLEGSQLGEITAPTIYYTEEGSGVFFMLTKDNLPKNPLDYMN